MPQSLRCQILNGYQRSTSDSGSEFFFFFLFLLLKIKHTTHRAVYKLETGFNDKNYNLRRERKLHWTPLLMSFICKRQTWTEARLISTEVDSFSELPWVESLKLLQLLCINAFQTMEMLNFYALNIQLGVIEVSHHSFYL